MADLEFIMEKDSSGKLHMWACRGEGKGCKRNKFRVNAIHCADCILPNENETLEEVKQRISRGDA